MADKSEALLYYIQANTLPLKGKWILDRRARHPAFIDLRLKARVWA